MAYNTREAMRVPNLGRIFMLQMTRNSADVNTFGVVFLRENEANNVLLQLGKEGPLILYPCSGRLRGIC